MQIYPVHAGFFFVWFLDPFVFNFIPKIRILKKKLRNNIQKYEWKINKSINIANKENVIRVLWKKKKTINIG